MLDQYADLFKLEMGTLRGTSVKNHVNLNVRPQFFRVRPVPYALQKNFTFELKTMQGRHQTSAVLGLGSTHRAGAKD